MLGEMVAAVEDKPTIIPKTGQKVLTEGHKANKIIKKARERKQPKSFDADVVLDVVDQTSPESTEDAREEKKPQGIVIDGRTYTCATCKTGHRVGICKHGRERPMTATHPPGRPSAGAPKKVICDCPKQCNCKKRDCKCARNCNCTQVMYMLVYVSAPGEEDDTNEENGSWKLGKQVMTDLKGNILTEEQVKERKEQKEAQKVQPEMRKLPKNGSIVRTKSATNTSSEPQSRGCCKHKENIDSRKIVTEASPQTGSVSMAAATGCNCGHLCACPFCPQHPNNSISLNMARQQAIYFANQQSPYRHDCQSIVSFMPNLPPGASCMGGAPQFAISRDSQMPSFHDLQRTFPNPGYVIGYPIYTTRTDRAGYSLAPFPAPSPRFMTSGVSNSNGSTINTGQPATPPIATPMSSMTGSTPGMMTASTPLISPDQSEALSPFRWDEFGIGDACVASAGNGGWNSNAGSHWMHDGPVSSASVADNTIEPPNFFVSPTIIPQESMNDSHIQHGIRFDGFDEMLHTHDGTAFFEFETQPMTTMAEDMTTV